MNPTLVTIEKRLGAKKLNLPNINQLSVKPGLSQAAQKVWEWHKIFWNLKKDEEAQVSCFHYTCFKHLVMLCCSSMLMIVMVPMISMVSMMKMMTEMMTKMSWLLLKVVMMVSCKNRGNGNHSIKSI